MSHLIFCLQLTEYQQGRQLNILVSFIYWCDYPETDTNFYISFCCIIIYFILLPRFFQSVLQQLKVTNEKKKKRVNVRSEWFRPVANSRQNHRRQVDPTQATVWSAERLMTLGLIEKSASGVRACVWVKGCGQWLIGHWATLAPRGAKVVENQKRGRWKSMISLKHRCADWQMDAGCE